MDGDSGSAFSPPPASTTSAFSPASASSSASASASDSDPLQLLRDELKDEDVALRLNSVKRLCTVALALGEARTRDDLIPFLSTEVEDEDEVMMTIAEELGKFTPVLGGPDYAHLALRPLEALANVEETVVREVAVASAHTIISQLGTASVSAHVISLVKRLTDGEWFASRSSACGLYAAALKSAPDPERAELLKLYERLSQDDTPMVRRSAAQSLGDVAASISIPMIKQYVIPAVGQLLEDDQDSVRVLALECSVSIAKLLTSSDNADVLLKLLVAGAQDKSWRVRYVFASKFGEIQERLDANIAKTDLLPIFKTLLQDPEAEVRTAAALSIPSLGATLKEADRRTLVKAQILPAVAEMCDPNSEATQHVRAAIATSLVTIASTIGSEDTVDLLIPLFSKLFKDEHHEVRMNVIRTLGDLQEVVGTKEISEKVLPSFIEVAEDRQWRVRCAIVEAVPDLAKSLDEKLFNSKLLPLLLGLLKDSVYSIRMAAARGLSDVGKILGEQWLIDNVASKITALAKDSEYMPRLTSLLTIPMIVQSKASASQFFDCVLPLCKDPVPNVRLNAAKALRVLAAHISEDTFAEKAKPLLEVLKSDDDVDVKFYSNQVLAAC